MKPKLFDIATDQPSQVVYVVHPAIEWAEPIIACEFASFNIFATVTCSKNGKHSELSRHFWKPGDARPSQAIDIRTRGKTGALFGPPVVELSFASALVNKLNFLAPRGPGGHFTIVMHQVTAPHIHLEWNPKDVIANVVGYTWGKEVYKA